ncbi:hypothetical protein RB595_004117 [Gaeumannomyces hyphopodioides]
MGEDNAFWPMRFLPKDTSGAARIHVYEYEGLEHQHGRPKSGLLDIVSAAKLEDQAGRLLGAIITHQENHGERPLIFVAHGFGGLICEQALVLAHQGTHELILNLTWGMILFGTPHFLAGLGEWALISAKTCGIEAGATPQRQDWGPYRSDLERIADMQRKFWNMHTDEDENTARKRIEMVFCFETLPVPTSNLMIAPEWAILPRSGAISIPADHFSMTKCNPATETKLRKVTGLLSRWISDAEKKGLRGTKQSGATETDVAALKDPGGNVKYAAAEASKASPPEPELGDYKPPQWLLNGCLQSLAFPQTRSHDIGRAATGTCEWLPGHEKYRSWAACDRSLLWIKGKPGSGKSTLLKHVLDKGAVSSIGESTLVLSFFFHDRSHELERTPLGLYKSLLHQLLSQMPDALPDLIDTFEKNRKKFGQPGEKWQWHQQQLQRFFELSLPNVLKTRSVWLFVDALDECGEQNAIDLVKWFESLLRGLPSLGLQFRVCFTCRHYPILAPDGAFGICLEDENRNDISAYVKDQLSAPHVRLSSIPALITARAEGIFMWARLVVKQVLDLDRKGKGLEAIEAAIQSTPPALDELYSKLIKGMGPDSLNLIQWICFSMRPLTTDELQWAMAVDPDGTYKSLDECPRSNNFITNDGMDTRIKALSRGLAEIVPSSNGQVIQFIHRSVKDFLEKSLSALDSSATSTDTAIGMVHHRLSKICIRYLAMEEIGRSTDHELRDFAFLHYATTSWVAHAKHGDKKNVPQDDLLECFAWPSNALVDLWVRVYKILNRYSRDCPPGGTSLVHVASRYQVVGLLSAILQRADKIGTEIDIGDGEGRTPLSYAAANGHEIIVKLLLDTDKVDVDSKDKQGRTPLSRAAENGHEAVVKLLLATGKVDVDSKDDSEQTPLSRAAGNGHEVAVKLLLATGKVDVNSKDMNYGQTPLSWAAEKGHEAIVKLLLATSKVDVDSKDDSKQTPLSWAAGNGHEAVVKLLLATGKVDVDSKDKLGRTPLSRAAGNGHKTVVKLLLATGKVDVDSKDDSEQTPLSKAAENGHEAVVKLLLATGKVNVDSKDKLGRTPLSRAAGNGHKTVVKLLLATGKVDVDSKDDSEQTPLSKAAENGHEAVVKLLLATGKVNVDSKDELGRTPLSRAAGNGHETVVKLLFATGKVDVDSKDDLEQTPLSKAAENRHEAVVKLLLATGKVDVDSKDKLGRTPLSRAAGNGHKTVVKLLLATGKVDVDSKDDSEQTPLSKAAENGREAVVKLLLATGKVDVDSKDDSEQTPLSKAAGNGHEAVVKLLLATGKVDVDSKDKQGRTPLSRAAASGQVDAKSKYKYYRWMRPSRAAGNGHEAVVKLLLATGKVDVESKDEQGRTPLSWAAANGHETVVKLLLATGKVDVESKDKQGRTPLSWAAASGQVDAKSRYKDYRRMRPSRAAGNGHEAVVKLLLATGKVNVESKDEQGRTPLSWAAASGHEAVAKLLK